MSSPQYEAINHLRNGMLSAASFLEATASRINSPGLNQEEIISRLIDQAKVLRDRERKATDIYFDRRTDKPSANDRASKLDRCHGGL